MIRCIISIALVFICCVGSGCTSAKLPVSPTAEEDAATYTLQNYDSKGKPTSITFRAKPRRVVAVWQNSVETLLALGESDAIVAALGVPHPECIKPEYRAAYAAIPIQQFKILDMEHLLLLEPDFILGWASTFTDRYTRSSTFWKSRGINTYIAKSSIRATASRTVNDEFQYIMDLGIVFAKEERATQLVNEMKSEIRSVQQKTSGKPRPRTLIIELIKDQIFTYDHTTLAGDILTQVGGELIPCGKTINYEDLIAVNPAVIFMVVSEKDYQSAEQIKQRILQKPSLQSVTAVQSKRVYIIPLFMVYSSAVRTYDGICLMASSLHPELYQEAVSND